MKSYLFLLVATLVAGMLGAANAWGAVPEWADFVAGKRFSYSSAGDPKAKGLDIRFEYPTSWTGKFAPHPNMPYQVTSEVGRGFEICNLVVRRLFTDDQIVNAQDVAEIFNPNEIKSLVAPGAQFISGGKTLVDGQPAGWIHDVVRMENAGLITEMESLTHVIYYDKRMVSFRCSVAKHPQRSSAERQVRFKNYAQLFRLIANSLIIADKWRN